MNKKNYKISTNYIFKNLLLIIRIHKDKDFIIEMFANQSVTVSRSQLKRWCTLDEESPTYASMPAEILITFIDELHEQKLFED